MINNRGGSVSGVYGRWIEHVEIELAEIQRLPYPSPLLGPIDPIIDLVRRLTSVVFVEKSINNLLRSVEVNIKPMLVEAVEDLAGEIIISILDCGSLVPSDLD